MYRVYADGPAGAHQPRHPPPARAAARQRPPPDRADERPAVLAARHAGPLLRRRDRHGRQHLPRRPQRRAHADAVERATATPASRAPTRSGSTCRSIIDPEYHYEAVNVEAQQREPALAAVVDAAPDRAAQALRRLRPRHARVPRRPTTARSSPSCASTRTSASSCVANLSRFAQYVELDLAELRGTRPGRAVRRASLPADRRRCRTSHASARTASTGSAPGRPARLPGSAAAAVRAAPSSVTAPSPRSASARGEGGARTAPCPRGCPAGAGSARRRGACAGGDRGHRVPDPSAPRARPRRPATSSAVEFTEGDSETYLPVLALAVVGYTEHTLPGSSLALGTRRRSRRAPASSRRFGAGAARLLTGARGRARPGRSSRGAPRLRAWRRDPEPTSASGRAEQHLARVRRPPDPQAVSAGSRRARTPTWRSAGP